MKQPDRIVGELLQPGGVSALEKLGLGHCLEGIDAIRVEGYDVIYHGQEVEIPYPEDAGKAFKAGEGMSGSPNEKSRRPEGRSFHHGKFINQLRETCLREPNITVVETTVTSTVSSTASSNILGVESLTFNTETGQKEKDYYFGQLTIIADGYASKFREQYLPHKPMSKSKFWALELIDADLPSPYHGHVILSDSAPVLLYQIGTHETRALIDIPESVGASSPTAVKEHLQTTVLPSLPACVRPSFEAALAEGKLRSMPNSWLPPSTQGIVPGLLILGDAMNMRHPLTGGGMTVAFNDVVLLSSVLSPTAVPSFSDAVAVRSAMKNFHWQRKQFSSVINILAQALYALFAADDAQLKALQLGCFAYFQRGGECVDGPVGLLAGIIKRPIVLFYHFFAVALLSIWIVAKRVTGGVTGVWKLPLAVLESLAIFWKACVVIFPFIFSEMRS